MTMMICIMLDKHELLCP
jgi:endonuclease/exonuclease/phosphatase family metal-dependent hydrolase